ncbi:hypothetical protein [Denitrobaculum tricleocarpae]|uniref:Uncharacterized protein n=1 Tax=Denitrobaculum tricleocarpae TaxID=2591009 RepID=A0A545TT02_9PROT|nr:hypothetical protein [Denitrobaculum tricleocarpae]TQV80342.1 hypothetical protein FKG95_09105 [Denitrobaculum tricleocarpae]
MTLKDQLLKRAEAFCTKERISTARFATIVHNQGAFFERLERGGTLTTATYEKFERVFSDPVAWEEAKAAAAARERASRQERMAS